MQTTIVGYPRIGADRELKFSTEAYFKNKLSYQELCLTAQKLRKQYWQTQKKKGIDMIPSNDFSYYDGMLDTALLVNAVPKRFQELELDPIQTYFAMARGYQQEEKDVKALAMKKWFNTNYHYIVPEIGKDTKFCLNGMQPFDLYAEAKEQGIETRPVLIGPFTFLKLSNLQETTAEECADALSSVYSEVLNRFEDLHVQCVQIDEPILVTDLKQRDIELFKGIYEKLLGRKYGFEIYLQTYFGDIRNIYADLFTMQFDGVGLDLADGPYNMELIRKHGFPSDKKMLAGLVCGRNIWKNDYCKTLETIKELSNYVPENQIILSTSCSLLHVPYTVSAEPDIDPAFKESLAFADEKLTELTELALLSSHENYTVHKKYIANKNTIQARKRHPDCVSPEVRKRVAGLKPHDFMRKFDFEVRRGIQKDYLKLPVLPTTTIGSFPQTDDIKKARKDLREGRITQENYRSILKTKIKELIHFQEIIDLDVLVHGEFERTDMVEYFGRMLKGFLFTENGWVQSYGTRAVKPPIIFGDIWREYPMTLEWSIYAQKQTSRPVKGMLTGPITILNWSFPREDLELKDIALQIALALSDEVADLEASGIRVIQIDEAALREKLPLRKENWYKEYLDWAIPAFRLTHARVSPLTQIHTHMCYSEFEDIIDAIEKMDADVISIESARSDFSILKSLKAHRFRLEIGPGLYDIHSPRVPSQEEIEEKIRNILTYVDADKVWINPDCGLKTREVDEALPSLVNMVDAAKNIRKTFCNG